MPVRAWNWRPVNKTWGCADRYSLRSRHTAPGQDQMNAKEWIATFAERAGTAPPSAAEFSTLLDLAGEAAHSSQRVAAPVACWVAAKAGLTPEEALALEREISGDGDD